MSGRDPGVRELPEWYEKLLSEMSRRSVPLDFFAWHIYEPDPTVYVDYAYKVRALLDKYGYASAESFLNEWNYIKSWTDDYQYSIGAMSGIKGAAFVCASMQEGQNCPIETRISLSRSMYCRKAFLRSSGVMLRRTFS